jgi:hypothetical protein
MHHRGDETSVERQDSYSSEIYLEKASSAYLKDRIICSNVLLRKYASEYKDGVFATPCDVVRKELTLGYV